MVEMDLKDQSNSPKGGEFARSFGKPNSVRKGGKAVLRVSSFKGSRNNKRYPSRIAKTLRRNGRLRPNAYLMLTYRPERR